MNESFKDQNNESNLHEVGQNPELEPEKPLIEIKNNIPEEKFPALPPSETNDRLQKFEYESTILTPSSESQTEKLECLEHVPNRTRTLATFDMDQEDRIENFPILKCKDIEDDDHEYDDLPLLEGMIIFKP